jgi:ABC-2 type transport system permease protein
MQTAAESLELRVNEPESRVTGRVRDLLRYRELLVNLVRKELRVKYKNSVLGFVWSMLNPALTLGIYYIVFTKFLRSGIVAFPIYLLSGLLVWNLWSASLGGAVGSLVGNANLVTKVYLPREILPLAAIGASLMHFFFQFVVLVLALIAFRYPVGPEALVLVPTGLVVELVLLVGVSLVVSVLNVYFRDVQHLLELVLLAWFWMTPIVYNIALVRDLGAAHPIFFRLYMLNPMTSVVLAFQRGVYGVRHPEILRETHVLWYLRNLGAVGLGAVVLIVVGWAIFRRLESRLAEEL